MRMSFNEVSIKAVRRFKDPETGKSRQQTKKFYQTLNPFNMNAAGLPKTSAEIMVEIRAERDAWLKEQNNV